MSGPDVFRIAVSPFSLGEKPHLSQAYTALAADVLARQLRADDRPARTAAAACPSWPALPGGAGAVPADFLRLWSTLSIRPDAFTDAVGQDGADAALAALNTLSATGDICPAPGGRAFRLARYAGPLLEHLARNPGFLAPSGAAEMIAAALKAGPADIPLPAQDAARALDFGSLLSCAATCRPHGRPALLLADRSEALRYGAVWPALLLALDRPLPARIFLHGSWLVDGAPASRAKGRYIKPEDLVLDYGADAVRYCLFRLKPFAADGDFTMESFRAVYDRELAGELSGIFSRFLSLAAACPEHRLPARPGDSELFRRLSAATPGIRADMENLRFDRALESVRAGLAELAAGVARTAPGAGPAPRPLLDELAWCLRLTAAWLDPFMPDTASRMLLHLGVGTLAPEAGEPGKIPPLFPKKS